MTKQYNAESKMESVRQGDILVLQGHVVDKDFMKQSLPASIFEKAIIAPKPLLELFVMLCGWIFPMTR